MSEKNDTVLKNQKTVDSKQKVVEKVIEDVSLKSNVQRPKTQAWVPRKN